MTTFLELLGLALAVAGAVMAWTWPAGLVVLGSWIVLSVVTR